MSNRTKRILVVTAFLAFFLAARTLLRASAEQNAIERVIELQGEYLFDFEVNKLPSGIAVRTPTFSQCLFHDVTVVNLANTAPSTADIAALSNCSGLQILWLANTDVGDCAVPAITKLYGLKELGIESTLITEKGAAELRTAFPDADLILEHYSPF